MKASEADCEVSMTIVMVRSRSEGTVWMPPRREPVVNYSVRVPGSLDERITAVRIHTGESAAAYALRAMKAQLAQDEAALKAQGLGQQQEGDEEKR